MRKHLKFDLNSLDDKCWKFAIEMELWRWNKKIAETFREKLWNSKYNVESHLECGFRIEETTVRSDKFLDKYKLFNHMCTRDKATIWTDWSIAWWCHCHMFFKDEYKDYITVWDLRKIAAYCYRIPFYLRSNTLWVIIRYRWYDWSYVSEERADIRDQRDMKWSIEMRFNEQVHWANLYFYLFVFDRICWSLTHWLDVRLQPRSDIVKSVRYWLFKSQNDWTSTCLNCDTIYDINWSYDLKNAYLWFRTFTNNIVVPIWDIIPAYSYDDYDIEELCTEFALFNYRIKCNVLPEHLDWVYKYFSFNMRGYPREWKKALLRSIQPWDRKNWLWMMPTIFWPAKTAPWRIMWRHVKYDWTLEQDPWLITNYDKVEEDNQYRMLNRKVWSYKSLIYS